MMNYDRYAFKLISNFIFHTCVLNKMTINKNNKKTSSQPPEGGGGVLRIKTNFDLKKEYITSFTT